MVAYWETWRHLYMLVVINFDAVAQQAIFKSKGDQLSSSAECRIRTRVSEFESTADWMPDWTIEDQAKTTWTQ